MSVLIKGMEMPKHNVRDGEKDTIYKGVIVIHEDNTAELIIHRTSANMFALCNETHLDKFPLTDVPTPHGRLIDADEIEKCVHEWYDVGEYVFADTIRNADTIIEAEVSE